MSLFRSPPLLLSGRHRTHWTTDIPPKVYWCGVGRQIGLRQYELELYRRNAAYPGKGWARSALSIKRVFPIRTAITARVPGGMKVPGSTSSTYSILASGSAWRTSRICRRSSLKARAPDLYALAARSRAKLRHEAD